MRHDFEDGKYTVILEESTGRLHALRYGESWRDLTGDKMFSAMLMEVDSLRAEVQSLRQELQQTSAARSGQTPLAQATPPADQTPTKPSPFEGIFAALAHSNSNPAPTHPIPSKAPEASEAQATPPADQTPAKPSPFAALARSNSGPAPTHPIQRVQAQLEEEASARESAQQVERPRAG